MTIRHWFAQDNRRLLLVTPPLSVGLTAFAPALLFMLLAHLEASSSAAVRDSAMVSAGVLAVAVLLSYLVVFVALATAAVLRVRLESLSDEITVLAGASLGALAGALSAPLVGTSRPMGSLLGAILGLATALIFAWLRRRIGISGTAS